MAALTEAQGASPASPASLDYLDKNVIGINGGTLANQNADPASPAGGANIYAKNGQVYTQLPSGTVGVVSTGKAGLTAAVTVANTTTETELLSYSIGASEPSAGAVYKLVAWGVYSVTGAPTLAFNSYYGGIAGTAIASVPAITAGSGVTGCLFELEAALTFYSTTKAQGYIKLLLGTSSSTDAASGYVASPTATAGVTVVSTSAKVFDVSLIWSAASASNTLSVLGGYGQRIA